MEYFRQINQQLKAVNYFWEKKLHLRRRCYAFIANF